MNQKVILGGSIAIIIIVILVFTLSGQKAQAPSGETASPTPTTSSAPTKTTSSGSSASKTTTKTSSPAPVLSGTHFNNMVYNSGNLSVDPTGSYASMTQLRLRPATPSETVTTFTVGLDTIWAQGGTRTTLKTLAKEQSNFPYLAFNVTASESNGTWHAREVDVRTVTFTAQRSAYFTISTSNDTIAGTAPTVNLFTLSNGMSNNNRVPSTLYNLFAGEYKFVFTKSTAFLINGVASTAQAAQETLSGIHTRATLKASGYISNGKIILTKANFVL